MKSPILTCVYLMMLLTLFGSPLAATPKSELIVSSSPGGSVILPREGTNLYPTDETVTIQATSADDNLFYFTGWTGTAVDQGLVIDPQEATTQVIAIGSLTLKANFQSILTTLIVDANAPQDPARNSSEFSDPLENGTYDHPYDTIQEALDVCGPEGHILVYPGHYHENLRLNSRVRHLSTQNVTPDHSCVVDGQHAAPVLQWPPDANAIVEGFYLIRGKGSLAGAIYSQNAQATLVNCVVAGNQATDQQGAILYAVNSILTLIHCTVTDNHLETSGATLGLINSHASVTNSLLWDATQSSIRSDSTSRSVVTYSIVAGGHPGSGNGTQYPNFVQLGSWTQLNNNQWQWTTGNYHLRTGSAAIDQAHPIIQTNTPTYDIDGQIRIGNGRGDMGADEWYSSYTVPTPPVDPPSGETYHFIIDPGLKAAVEKELGILDPSISDMLNLYKLDAQNFDIASLEGLEYATNLQTLDADQRVGFNRIRSLEPLSGLTNLIHLNVNNNRISDISPIAGLYNLEYLDIHDNLISDLSPLAGLTKLREAYLYRNAYTDISALAHMPDLEYLNIGSNPYTHVNPVSDISALTSLTKLKDISLIYLPLNQAAYDIHIPQIRANNPGVFILLSQ